MSDDNTANDVYNNPDATGGDSTPPTTPVEPPQAQSTDPNLPVTPPASDPAGNPADDGGDLELPQQPGAADPNAGLGSTPDADEHKENGGAEV